MDAQQRDVDLVRSLLDDGIDVNSKIKGLTPLHVAVKTGKENYQADCDARYRDT